MNTLTRTATTEWRHEFLEPLQVRREHRFVATAHGLEVHVGESPPAVIPWMRIDQARELVCARVAEVQVTYGIPNQTVLVEIVAQTAAAAEAQARGAKEAASGPVRAKFLRWKGFAAAPAAEGAPA